MLHSWLEIRILNLKAMFTLNSSLMVEKNMWVVKGKCHNIVTSQRWSLREYCTILRTLTNHDNKFTNHSYHYYYHYLYQLITQRSQ